MPCAGTRHHGHDAHMLIPPCAPMRPFMVTLPPRTVLTTPDNSCSSVTPAIVPQVLTQSAAQHTGRQQRRLAVATDRVTSVGAPM